VGGAIGKLEAELRARTDALAAVRGELVGRIAEAAWQAHPPSASGATFIVAARPAEEIGALRTLAGRLASRPDVVAVVTARDPSAPDAQDALVVIQRGDAVKTFDCGAWLKSTAAARGGRGGGRPERAEGRLVLTGPALEDDLRALL
jgi:alanyl-tRNA synthetase